MKVRLLGTGTSGGVPSLGCGCDVCKSLNPHDKRLRCAALLETNTTRVLIDCGPDIRQQLLNVPFKKIDGVLLTHIHYDHAGGIDDLRPFGAFGDIEIYCNEATANGLIHNMPYCFGRHLYPGVPKLKLNIINPHEQFNIGDLNILPIEVMHDKVPILGFRIGQFAYITDMKSIDDQNKALVNDVNVLVVNALRWSKPHHSHMLIDDAIKFANEVGAKHTFLIHMSHKIGLHDDANSRLPNNVRLAFDGLEFTINE
jgi:phosphoribosyl 1,2-cyclic phosphate phosphodiesterase